MEAMEEKEVESPEPLETEIPENAPQAPLSPSIPPPPPFRREALTPNILPSVTFERDAVGNLLCRDYRSHHVFKGKVIVMSEAEAWKATRKMTAKEQKFGAYNPGYPLGPYRCPAHKHWHIGHHTTNVGRIPSRVIRLQLWVEDVVDLTDRLKWQTHKVARQLRKKLDYRVKKNTGDL